MAIEKNNVKVAVALSKVDTEFSIGSRSRDSMSSDEDDIRERDSVDSEDDDEFDDADSGAGSDDFDLLELGETGSEFCQVGDQTCCIPFELYDLPDLNGILSLDVWNECLSEDEKFSLTKYLPDMDQETFMRTLKELFEGGNFHFGNPVDMMYKMLKGGLCEPRVALYRQGLNFFQMHQHYHFLHKRQESMIDGFLQMREAWQKCKGYGIEEKLRVLNIVRSQKSLMGERDEGVGSDSSEMEESANALWKMRSKGLREPSFDASPSLDAFSRGRVSKPNSRLLMADEQERMYDMTSQRDWDIAQGNVMDQVQAMKRGKKRIAPRGGEYDVDSYSTPHHSAQAKFSPHGRSLNINQLSDIQVLTSKPSNVRAFYDPAKRAKYGESIYKDQMEPVRGRAAQMPMQGSLSNYADGSEPYWSNKTQRQGYPPDPSFDYEVKDGETRKMKLGKEVPNSRFKNNRDGRIYLPDKRSNVFQDNFRGVAVRGEGPSMFPLKSERIFHGGEDTESDSSDQIEEGNKSHLIMPNRALHGFSVSDKKEKQAKRSVMGNTMAFEGMLPAPSAMSDFGRHVQSQEMNNYYLKGRQSAKTQHVDAPQNFASRFPEIFNYGDLGNTNAERNRMSAYILGRNGQVQGLPVPTNSAFPFERRSRENVGHETLSRKSKHMQGYSMEANGVRFEGDPMRRHNKGFDATLIGCTSTSKKHKRREGFAEMDEQEGSDYMQSHDPVYESISLKNRGKKRQEDNGSLEQPVTEAVVVVDLEPEIKPQKKPSPLITPTIHTGFSFSVIHLLSAVRESLTTPKTEDSSEAQKPLENLGAGPEDQNAKHEQTNGSLEQIDVNNPAPPEQSSVPPLDPIDVNNPAQPEQSSVPSLEPVDVNNPAQPEQSSVPSLTVHEIVNRVRSNPGDPSILETQEPLQDLVRGVLKVFSSKTAPLGAKAWKPLISYEKSTKRWSWTGPEPQTPTEYEPLTSPEAWRIPRKMLVKLVDAFANWLKCGQETLQQIGSLPAPPPELLEVNFDEKERFKDLRAQKSLPTFSPSSDEVRAYFRKEEQLRYSVPDRAFSYTAADGKKSIVAPLRRCGGKPTSKARDHFMLKPDRPPHVTILCLVRDAAARLPGSIGTRADVCTLIRDSQYMVEDISDAQVNQVVSGALDRLHYERDPCVQFEGERKLWVYLHRSREEEDFEDDGTSSTKKWKRQKKDPGEQDDQVTVARPESVEPTEQKKDPSEQDDQVTVARPESVEPIEQKKDPSEQDDQVTVARLESVEPTDLNAEPPCMNDDKVVELMHDDTRVILKDDAKANHIPEQVSMLESGTHCLENSKNKDVDDKA